MTHAYLCDGRRARIDRYGGGLATMRPDMPINDMLAGLPDDATHVNPNGGAIAPGHPLGKPGTRLALTASINMVNNDLNRVICTTCIGVEQGIALLLEKP